MQRIFIKSDRVALDREQETGGHDEILYLCPLSERARMDKRYTEMFFPSRLKFKNFANHVLAKLIRTAILNYNFILIRRF